MLSLTDFVNHDVVGGGEEVGFRFRKVHGLDFFPNTGKALLHHILGLLAIAEARKCKAEKPIGKDLASAIRVNEAIGKVFPEERVYRIDHYLGKETVQNILMLRFANVILEPVWCRRYIRKVEITAAEELGVEGRGRYYDQAGAVRDMLQKAGFGI